MSSNVYLGDVLTLSSPLTYFFGVILLVILISVREIITTTRILKGEGIQLSYSLFGNPFANIFKWTSVHQTKTGVIMILIVLSGIIMAIRFGV